MRLAEDKAEWVVGFEDECWWSRAAQPNLHSFSEVGEPLRLVEHSLPKDDPDPKAISCYGLYMPELKMSWLRFVDGRPVSAITTQFLEWCCQKLEELGKKLWVLIWDNASWHISREVRRWIGKRNREVKNSGSEAGVRIATCLLPKKSPWLSMRWSPSGSMANARWSSPTHCWVPTSWPSESARLSTARTTNIYPFPKMSPERALVLSTRSRDTCWPMRWAT
jgi:hypothetical protein